MFNWKTLLSMVLPMLEALGYQKVNEDENETGKDDIMGSGILLGVKIFRAVLIGDTAKLEKLVPPSQRGIVTKDSFKPSL